MNVNLKVETVLILVGDETKLVLEGLEGRIQPEDRDRARALAKEIREKRSKNADHIAGSMTAPTEAGKR